MYNLYGSAMNGPRAWIGGILTRSGLRCDVVHDNNLGPNQDRRLQRLQERAQVPFDESRPDHRDALKAFWHAGFPDVRLEGLISDQWKEMGWQGTNPSTDFRSCGFIALENLLYFARTYPVFFRRLLFKEEGKRSTWEYPFAVAARPKTRAGLNFLKLLAEDEEAFDVLFCVAFVMMDALWLATHASYMNFNEVLQATKTQLDRELSVENIHHIRELPAYCLLYK